LNSRRMLSIQMPPSALTCAFTLGRRRRRSRNRVLIPPSTPSAVSRGVSQPGSSGRADSRLTLLRPRVCPPRSRHERAGEVVGAATRLSRSRPASLRGVVWLPIAGVGVVSLGDRVVDGHAQDGQQGQARDQHSSTETESRQLAVLDGARHRAHVDAEDWGCAGAARPVNSGGGAFRRSAVSRRQGACPHDHC
jgi:hypothetical protein